MLYSTMYVPRAGIINIIICFINLVLLARIYKLYVLDNLRAQSHKYCLAMDEKVLY